jgi:hypothetical protein
MWQAQNALDLWWGLWVVKTLMNVLPTNRYDQTWTGRNADDLLRFYEIKGL